MIASFHCYLFISTFCFHYYLFFIASTYQFNLSIVYLNLFDVVLAMCTYDYRDADEKVSAASAALSASTLTSNNVSFIRQLLQKNVID